MQELITLLLFVGLFFVMMRFGCGAHMKHKNHGENTHQQKHTDSVCGLHVDPKEGYGKMYEGTLYRFCSLDCLSKFEENPQQYVKNNLSHDNHGYKGDAL